MMLVDFIGYLNLTPAQINESISKNNGLLVVEGVIQRANAKNGNGRVYPKMILEREVGKYQDLIANNNALGCLDHYDTQIVELKNASHKITKLWWEGDDLCGRMEILSTPYGNIAKELFLNKVNVGISSRGTGSVKNIGEVIEVQDDFELVCWDLVSVPSTKGAYLNMISEGLSPQNSKYSKINNIINDILINY